MGLDALQAQNPAESPSTATIDLLGKLAERVAAKLGNFKPLDLPAAPAKDPAVKSQEAVARLADRELGLKRLYVDQLA
jgi:hypothetical protein